MVRTDTKYTKRGTDKMGRGEADAHTPTHRQTEREREKRVNFPYFHELTPVESFGQPLPPLPLKESLKTYPILQPFDARLQ